MSRAAIQSQFRGHQATHNSPIRQSRDHGGPADEKPSRLLQMREDYQRRLLREKEEKLVSMYEDNQRRNEERAERVTRLGQGAAYPNSRLRQPGYMQERQHPAPGHMPSSPSVRDFFRERRELEAKGEYVPPIDQHYKQSKSRTSSGHSFHKNSAGVDRSQPLAPINNNRRSHPSSPLSQQQPPFNNKARMVKHHPNPSPDADENGNYKPLISQQRSPPKKPAPPARAPPNRGLNPGRAAKEEKMSDFQKWQLEQTKAREERLRKSVNGGSQQSGSRESSRDFHDEDDGGETPQSRQERELLEKIAKQQAELDRMKMEREKEEERERQEAAERERRQQQRQQQEARRRRDEEAQARRREEQEAAQRRAFRASKQDRFENVDDDPVPRSNRQDRYQNVNDEDSQSPPASNRAPTNRWNGQQGSPRRPPQQLKTARGQPSTQRRPPEEDEEEELVQVPGAGTEIYSQAMEGETVSGKVRLVPCKLCGRKFAADRVQKHQDACKKTQKKRKVFDPTKMRTEGTEMAKYVGKKASSKKEPPKKKADWRRQHEEFIANIRYAKQMQQMEQQGVALKDLPPPPPSHNPDLVPCPHCGRTFNDVAAERHIPRCQNLNTRPAATRRR